MKRVALILVLTTLTTAAVLTWWFTHRRNSATELVLHGNLDLRQVDLAFNNNERIAAVLVQEGDRIQRGMVVARLETSRLEPQVAQAQAIAAAQRQAVQRLRNGNRPEEIAQARANLVAAQVDAANARQQYDRVLAAANASGGKSISKQDLDNARAAMDVADARATVNQKTLDLQVAGPRKEDIAQAEAQLQGNEAQLALLQQQLKDADLIAPIDAVVRSRLMEPGEMASPQKPVFSLAITNPKWVRAYVSEMELANVHQGMTASVAVDSVPTRRFEGWVGFISSVAEFTPKSVETAELRSSLVYEVRVFVKDPADELRLGMPATVYLPLHAQASVAATQPAAGGH